MSDWIKRREFYAQQSRLDDQLYEDMLARRVIKGLGFNNASKGIYKAEQVVLGQTRGDLPLWHRAREILPVAINRYSQHKGLLSNAVIDSFEVEDYTEAYERMSAYDWQSRNQRPVLFTKKKNTHTCYVYTYWTTDEFNLHRLAPPYTVLPADDYPKWFFTQQEAAHFVAQFGPYGIDPTEI